MATCTGTPRFALPPDVLVVVFGHLRSVQDICRARQVSRSWRDATADTKLWQRLYQADWNASPNTPTQSAGSVLGQPVARQPPAHVWPTRFAAAVGGPPTSPQCNWMAAYKLRAAVARRWNWALDRDPPGTRLEEAVPYLNVPSRNLRHGDFIRCVFVRQNRLIVVCGSILKNECCVRVWDLDSCSCQLHLLGPMEPLSGPVWGADVSEDGRLVAVVDDEGYLVLWDVDDVKAIAVKTSSSEALRCVCLDERGRHVAVGGAGWALWNLDDLVQAMLPAQQLKECTYVAQAADVPPKQPFTAIPGRSRAIDIITIAGDLCIIISGKTIVVVSLALVGVVATNLYLKSIHSVPNAVASLCVDTTDGQTKLILGCHDGHVASLEATCSVGIEPLMRLEGAGNVHAMAMSDKWLVAANNDNVAVKDLSTEEVFQIELPDSGSDMVTNVQLQGNVLAFASGPGQVVLLDLKHPEGSVRVLDVHRDRVWALAMDCWRLVTAGLDGKAVVHEFF